MRSDPSTFPLLVVLLLLSSPHATADDLRNAANQAGMSSTRLERLDSRLQQYIDDGRLPGAVVLVARHGRIAHVKALGSRDLELGKAMTEDTIFRIYSMTKPITTVAALILVEQGRIRLDDPVTLYIPDFGSAGVLVEESAGDLVVEPLARAVTIHDLLTHTSGLPLNPPPDGSLDGYPEKDRPILSLYYKARLREPQETLEMTIAKLVKLPLQSQPGDAFRYGMATDVVGRIIEIVSGTSLDQFFREEIFEPLEMHETGFAVPREYSDRIAKLYAFGAKGLQPIEVAKGGSVIKGERRYLSGSGGLVSTAPDYARFCQMLLSGGVLGDVRLLSRKSVEIMMLDHLPRHAAATEPIGPGRSFGLGGWVVTDPAQTRSAQSIGAFGWAGGANTYFFVDPREDLFAIVMTQLRPFRALPLLSDLSTLVYQALDD